ncbi:hypothetical protein [Methanorbis furvi]|uniref:Uncharacterized protein n=1 Tax=Methanorbis furvi TaxID=3028299 RepID=A0AAE4S9W5_9EURY|nr:hypothetical protein [Methanocorpusculaceae archaeon Ag1]
MSQDPNTGADPKKVEELQKEVERLNREKAEAQAQAEAEAHAAAAAADEKAATEMRMKQELESQKIAADAKMQSELEAQRLAAKESELKRKEKQATSKSRKRKVIGGIILLIILVLIVLAASASVQVQPGSATSYPYITTYGVWFPIGQPVDISGHTLIALADGNEMMFSADGSVTKLVRGQPITIGEQSAKLTTLFGKVPLMTINYKVILEYQGNTPENQAYFKMLIQSDKSIPEFVVKFLLPKNVIAQPMAS